MHRVAVINAVGLTPALIGLHTPRLRRFADDGAMATIDAAFPAVTTAAQSTYLTGMTAAEHGIVGNGWYFRDECEIRFWRQSGRLVLRPRIWDAARKIDPSFTCANLFWWYAMYSSADVTVTPRPMYPADGRKLPDVWTHPADLRESLQQKLGQFPLFKFWGPATSIEATRWIADAAIQVDEQFHPTLSLVYLPHLDYSMQRLGPDPAANARDLQELDAVCAQLIDHYTMAGVRIIVLSEYGITPVSRPVHLNRLLREKGFLAVRTELGRELLDAGESRAFAVADHQIAHIYVNDQTALGEVRSLLEKTAGVERVLDEEGKRAVGLDHPRSGELVAVAAPDAWFTYYYWLEDRKMPDFAPTVDIHRKPGYDPAELFFDPAMTAPKLKVATTLLRRKLGFRALLEVIPTDGNLVGGSHGRWPDDPQHGPLILSGSPKFLTTSRLPATSVFDTILRHLTEPA